MPPKVDSKSAAAAAAATAGNTQETEDLQKYQKMTDQEHILKKPDTYIGTIEPTETMEYVMDAASATVTNAADEATTTATAAP